MAPADESRAGAVSGIDVRNTAPIPALGRSNIVLQRPVLLLHTPRRSLEEVTRPVIPS